jgi:methyl-accepting chemotaxis protein
MSSPSRPLSLRACVLLLVAGAALGAAVLGGLGLQHNRDGEALTDRLLADVGLTRAALMVDMVHDGLLATTRAALLAGPDAPADAKAEVRRELAGFHQTLAEAQALVAAGATDPAVRQAEAELRPEVARYARDADRLVDAALDGRGETASLRTVVEQDFRALEQRLDAFAGLIASQAQARVQQRDALFASQRWWLLGAAAAMVSALLVAGLLFARNLLARLGAEPPQLNRFAQEIAEGILFSDFPGAPPPAGSVAGALVAMRDRLASTVKTIRSGAEGVAVGAAQIAGGNQDLAERTNRQAVSLQQAAGGMAAVTSGVAETADHAQAAAALAGESSAVASLGGDAVGRVVATMAGIDATSRRIAEITNQIDDIAAQTNILALNAAVEASRAGEHGQGFAVVAGEVRRLARRSAGAAREIKGLIQGSLAQAADGSRQVADAGRTVGEIVAQVGRVNALIAAISGAARAQTDGITEVGASVRALDEGTQQNAALVEQGAAAAVSLRDQAQRLADAVAVFRLGDGA